MNKVLIYLSIFTICLLSACSWKSQNTHLLMTSKHLEFQAMLSDPSVKQNFRNFKKIAMGVHVYKKNGVPAIADRDLRNLSVASNKLITELYSEYHLSSHKYKIHTHIGSNKYGSCYQYFNSANLSAIGKNCSQRNTCQRCNKYLKALRSRVNNIFHYKLGNKAITEIASTFKLNNGDDVYVGLEISEI